MKKSIFLIAFLILTGLSNVFANNEETVNKKVKDAFNSEFADARDISWENSKSFAKATFKLNDQVMFAYFSFNGELLAVTRNMASSQLPINLQADLKKQFGQYWITDLFEMSTSSDTNYFITLESADYTLVLKSNGSVGWYTFKKEKK